MLLKLHILASKMECFLTPYGQSNCAEEKLPFTPFGGGPKLGCSDTVRSGIIESLSFRVLHPILVKFHIPTWLIEIFPMTYCFCWCAEEKLHFTPVQTLRQLKRYKALFPPFLRVIAFRARYGKKTACRFGG